MTWADEKERGEGSSWTLLRSGTERAGSAGIALEREVRFAKLTVKLLFAAEVKREATLHFSELRLAGCPASSSAGPLILQDVSIIIARMVAIIEKDAREPREILADGAEHFTAADLRVMFTAWQDPEAFGCGGVSHRFR